MLYSNEKSFGLCGVVACVTALLFCANSNNVKAEMKPCSISSDLYRSVNYIQEEEKPDYLKEYLGRKVFYRNVLNELENLKRAEELEEEIEEEIRDGEIELLAQLIEAEAGNQDFEGKCLVADVVLNRIKSDRFPDSIEEVIFDEGQFSCISDGGFEKAGWSISEDSFKAAKQEYEGTSHLDYHILFFTAGFYNPYCIPAYKHGDHYFGY